MKPGTKNGDDNVQSWQENPVTKQLHLFFPTSSFAHLEHVAVPFFLGTHFFVGSGEFAGSRPVGRLPYARSGPRAGVRRPLA